MVISLGAALFLGFWRRSLDLGWVYDNYVPLLTASVGRQRGRLLAACWLLLPPPPPPLMLQPRTCCCCCCCLCCPQLLLPLPLLSHSPPGRAPPNHRQVLFSSGLSLYLYISSHAKGALLAHGGNTGGQAGARGRSGCSSLVLQGLPLQSLPLCGTHRATGPF